MIERVKSKNTLKEGVERCVLGGGGEKMGWVVVDQGKEP